MPELDANLETSTQPRVSPEKIFHQLQSGEIPYGAATGACSPDWFDLGCIINPFEIGRYFLCPRGVVGEIRQTNKRTETYIAEKALDILQQNPDLMFTADILRETIAMLTKQLATAQQTSFRNPTFWEVERRMQEQWMKRFPGISREEGGRDPVLYPYLRQMQARAEHEEVVTTSSTKTDEILERQQMLLQEIKYQLSKQAFLDLLSLQGKVSLWNYGRRERKIMTASQLVHMQLQRPSESDDEYLIVEVNERQYGFSPHKNFSQIFDTVEQLDTVISQNDTKEKLIGIVLRLELLGWVRYMVETLDMIKNNRDYYQGLIAARIESFMEYDLSNGNLVTEFLIGKRLREPIRRLPSGKFAVNQPDLKRYFLKAKLLGLTNLSLQDVMSFFDPLDEEYMSSGRTTGKINRLSVMQSDTDRESLPRQLFSSPEEENRKLEDITFSLAGKQRELRDISELVFPDRLVGNTVTLSNTVGSNDVVSVVSLKPTQTTIWGELALAVPPGWEVVGVNVYKSNQLLQNGELRVNSDGQYFMVLPMYTGQIDKYELQIRRISKEHVQQELFLNEREKERLGDVASRISNMGPAFTRLATYLGMLLQDQNRSQLSTRHLETAIKDAMQYTILGQDNTIPRTFTSDMEQTIALSALGFDEETGFLRVQCDHAAWITRAILKEVFTDSDTSISIRTLVKEKSRQKDTLHMGSLHSDVKIVRGDKVIIMDTTPFFSDDVKERELGQNVANSTEEEIITGDTRKNQILDRVAQLNELVLEQQIVNLHEFIINTNSDVAQISGKIPPLAALYTILARLYDEKKLSPEERVACKKILQNIIDIGNYIQSAGGKRREVEEQLHRQYGLGRGIKKYDFFMLGLIAKEILNFIA